MSATPSLECDCEFAPNIFIKKRRIHQVFGPSRIRMLLFLAKKISGPIFWIKSPDEKIFLHPDGIYPWMNSSRITFVYTDSQYDKLWAIENIIKETKFRNKELQYLCKSTNMYLFYRFSC